MCTPVGQSCPLWGLSKSEYKNENKLEKFHFYIQNDFIRIFI